MTKKNIKTSIKEKRRQRKGKVAITSNDELYSTLGGEIFAEKPTESKLKKIKTKIVERKRLRPLRENEYNYKAMATKYSETNVAQQLGNYRQAMEFLAHVTLSKNIDNDKIVDKLKDLMYSYPNVDMSSFVNKHHAILYSWIIENLVRVYGQKYLGTIYILGGGIGMLGAMLLDTALRLENIRSLDINGTCKFLADEMMKKEVLNDWKFKASTQDLFEVGYETNRFSLTLPDGTTSKEFSEVPGIVINTNTSYLANMEEDWYKKMIPDTRKMVLVGETGNVSRPYSSSKEFNATFPMAFEQYTGTLTIEDKQYYMKIGIK
tara:strand:+ start:379 stop:1338 length:960 start_codon:yes stop_codon:yes gene_type:complete